MISITGFVFTVLCDGAWLSQGWLNSHLPWDVLSEGQAFLRMHLWLYQLNWLYLNPPIFAPLPFQFSALSHCGAEGEAERAQLPVGLPWCFIPSVSAVLPGQKHITHSLPAPRLNLSSRNTSYLQHFIYSIS